MIGAVTAALGEFGQRLLLLAYHVGGLLALAGALARALFTWRRGAPDGRELWSALYRMGNRSVAIVVATSLFAGGLMAIQAGTFVRKLGATGLAGWGAGYAVLREIGPILIGLMFSGRVGANTTAELATMTVTEQLDGLRALGIEPLRHLVLPRVLAMTFTLVVLTIIGSLVALVGASIVGYTVLGIEWSTMYFSFADNLAPGDFLHGVQKSLAFGLAIALSSCYFGLAVERGAAGVGRAVNASVVSSAVAIVVLDFFLTYLTS